VARDAIRSERTDGVGLEPPDRGQHPVDGQLEVGVLAVSVLEVELLVESDAKPAQRRLQLPAAPGHRAGSLVPCSPAVAVMQPVA
jgi:hypothetical protein